MADFQYPDLLGSYVRGQMAPGMIQGQQQQLAEGGLRLDQLRLALQNQRMTQDYAQQIAGQVSNPGYAQQPAGLLTPAGQPGGFAASGAQNLNGPTGGIQNGPQGAVAGGPSSPNVSGYPPFVNTAMALDVLNGRDPLTSMQKAQGLQLEQRKLQLQGPMNLAERVARDPQANIVVANNPSLLTAWKSWAAQHGLNPDDPTNITVDNAQRSAADYHAMLGAQVGLPPKEFGFSGTLAPGQVAYQDGRQVAGSATAMTPYQQQELVLRRNEAALANQRFKFEQDQSKIPGGYERDPNDPNGIRPIAGGPHDPNAVAAGMDSRSSVMFQRVASSAQAAIQSIKNIGELPITTSTGWFGSAQPGGSLLGSVKSVLAQSITGQDAQDMKTMIAGVSRNLATIETAGLAPNGSLTHSMDSITIGEGDTQMTKLRKMAEMRQIVEENLKPQLSNPKLPPVQKQLVTNLISGVQQAVPFTHHDITMLERSNNPNATVMDFAKQSGLPTGANGAVTASGPNGQKLILQGNQWVPANGR